MKWQLVIDRGLPRFPIFTILQNDYIVAQIPRVVYFSENLRYFYVHVFFPYYNLDDMQCLFQVE